MTAKSRRIRFRLTQFGVPVAWAEGPTALAEIMHYARVYSQDAPVEIEWHRAGKWRRMEPNPKSGASPRSFEGEL